MGKASKMEIYLKFPYVVQSHYTHHTSRDAHLQSTTTMNMNKSNVAPNEVCVTRYGTIDNK